MKNYTSKIIFIILILLSIHSLLIAQSQVNTDSRLLKKFSQDRINNLISNKPEVLEKEIWMLDNSFDIIIISNEKAATLSPLKSFSPENKTIGNDVQDIDLNNFNIYEVYFERYDDKPSLYRIGNTGKVISFHSFRKLTNDFNKYRNE